MNHEPCTLVITRDPLRYRCESDESIYVCTPGRPLGGRAFVGVFIDGTVERDARFDEWYVTSVATSIVPWEWYT